MFTERPTENMWRSEDGGFVGSAIVIAVIVAVAAVLFMDGSSSFKAYESAGVVSEEAARKAVVSFKQTRSEVSAENAAAAYCEEEGLDFLDFQVVREVGRSFEVTCGRGADTYSLKYIPFLKDLTYHQQTIMSESVF